MLSARELLMFSRTKILLSEALLFEDRHADRNHPNRSLCLVLAAADCLLIQS